MVGVSFWCSTCSVKRENYKSAEFVLRTPAPARSLGVALAEGKVLVGRERAGFGWCHFGVSECTRKRRRAEREKRRSDLRYPTANLHIMGQTPARMFVCRLNSGCVAISIMRWNEYTPIWCGSLLD
jgi:hypothetical protein